MLWKKDEICPFTLEDGIVMDYLENRFVIIVKDELWSDFEKQALQRNKLNIYFLYERVCAIFLLENVDSIDTSDIIFNIKNCDEKDACIQQMQYEFEIYLIDKENKVCAIRSVTMDKASSTIIREALTMQMNAPFDEEGFDRALMKLQGRYEPFEMEDMALVKAKF